MINATTGLVAHHVGRPAPLRESTFDVIDALDRLLDVIVMRHLARIVVAIDGIRAPLGHTMFGAMRDCLWEAPVTWVVATEVDQAALIDTPPADALFGARFTLVGACALGSRR